MDMIFKNKIRIIYFLICVCMCLYSCNGQRKYDNLPSKDVPKWFKGDTCIIVLWDIEYFLKGYIQVGEQEIADMADSLIDSYCDQCEQQQSDFIEYKFLICMYTKQYDKGIQFIEDHPADEEFAAFDLLNREFYTTTLLSAKCLKNNDLEKFDSINKVLQKKLEANISVQSAIYNDKTQQPLNLKIEKHFPELFESDPYYQIQNYYILRARTSDIDAVLSELYNCKKNYPDSSSTDYYRLSRLIEIIEYIKGNTYPFEYDL